MDSVEAVAVEDEFKIPLPLFDLSSPPVAIRTASALTSGGMTSWLTWGPIQLDKNLLENPHEKLSKSYKTRSGPNRPAATI